MLQLRHRILELHLRHTFRLARGATDSRRNLIVELEDDGLIGLGEAAPIARYDQDADSAARAALQPGAAGRPGVGGGAARDAGVIEAGICLC